MSAGSQVAGPLEFAGVVVKPGTGRRVDVPIPGLPVGPPLTVPCKVLHGRSAGPRMWLSAAIHGDELNGIEIIRRVLDRLDARALHGTVVAVPTVNVFGMLQEQRYLPDRRDLNRCFPGSSRGSLASRLARLFMETIVEGSTFGIDLHTASDDRDNLPQVRCDLDQPETLSLAQAFGAPVIIHSTVRDGSLRKAATARGIHVLVYEGGQALRFDEAAIEAGVRGVLAVLTHTGIWPAGGGVDAARPEPRQTRKTSWVRTPRAGFARLEVGLGDYVTEGQHVGHVAGPFGGRASSLTARRAGVIIGLARNPLVYQGDAIVHVAHVEDLDGD